MKTQQRLLVLSSLAAAAVDAYVVAPSRSSSFVGRPGALAFSRSSTKTIDSAMRMDLEKDDTVDCVSRYSLDRLIQENTRVTMTLEDAEAEHGMPWKSSIDETVDVDDEGLLYMPFWEWQMEFMKDNLTNLRVESCSNGDTDFSYNENLQKKARIVNLCASSEEYRKIRLTYYDAGDGAQVFNSVWYPDPKYDLPVLGIDLLAFNRKKYLAIVDFQPLHDDVEQKHAVPYEHLLKPIKEKYDSLKGRMSSKFYDETQFFSQQMLFARFEDEDVVSRDLLPAFKSYVQTHLDLVRDTDADESQVQAVLGRQKAYDTYSAERDPATGLFAAMFGPNWAQNFVHDFLFSMSERKEGGSPPATPPFMGGGGPPAQQQRQQKPTKSPQKVAKASKETSRQPAFSGARR